MFDHVKIHLAPRMLLLFCIFLVAQGQALAHEFDHLASGDGSSCMVCPVGSNLQAAATDSGDLPALTLLAAPAPASVERRCSHAGVTGFSARAPPSFL